MNPKEQMEFLESVDSLVKDRLGEDTQWVLTTREVVGFDRGNGVEYSTGLCPSPELIKAGDWGTSVAILRRAWKMARDQHKHALKVRRRKNV